jgi:AraC-like DNA-binding protein
MNIYDVYSYFSDEDNQNDIFSHTNTYFFDDLTDDKFESILLDSSCAIINPALFVYQKESIDELALFDIKKSNNLYIYRHPNYYQDIIHIHNYFEMFYIFRGTCKIIFDEKHIILKEGDFILIAPGTTHFVESDEDNFILNISMKQSNFESIFHSEMSNDNILAMFFRNIIYNKMRQGYILFHTKKKPVINYIIKNMTLESRKQDNYSFSLGNCWLTILFSNLMRDHYLNMEIDPPIYNNDFLYILSYINKNYKSVTLDILSREFHYSKTYLCSIIRKNTGHTLSDLVNRQKTLVAANLLEDSLYSVEEISVYVGFSSADHFSRTFKKIYGQSPSAYKSSLEFSFDHS